MRRVNAFTVAATMALGVFAGLAHPVHAQVTVFEGARVIVGDGSAPIENATLIIDGAKIDRIGRGAGVSVPAGATRVDVAGKTIMPALIDTHIHISSTTDSVTRDLKQRAYYGVGAVQSMGTDES